MHVVIEKHSCFFETDVFEDIENLFLILAVNVEEIDNILVSQEGIFNYI